jgi:hypothetical protein
MVIVLDDDGGRHSMMCFMMSVPVLSVKNKVQSNYPEIRASSMLSENVSLIIRYSPIMLVGRNARRGIKFARAWDVTSNLTSYQGFDETATQNLEISVVHNTMMRSSTTCGVIGTACVLTAGLDQVHTVRGANDTSYVCHRETSFRNFPVQNEAADKS